MQVRAQAASVAPTLETTFSWSIFPATLGIAIAAAIVLMNRGVNPVFAMAAPMAATYVFVALCERVFPHREEWLGSKGDVHVDVGHLIVSGALTLETLRPFMLTLGLAGAAWLTQVVGSDLWPARWPIIAQLALALVVGEFFMYWIHRLTHEVDLLFRVHAVHHSAPRLYFLNAVRFHPIDLALSNFSPYVPLVMLGAGPEVLALFTLVSGVHGVFQHANLRIRCGPLNWIFSMAELHRWHHSRELSESNTNYGQNLIVWDVVFGTRYLPKDRTPPGDTGLDGLPAFPMTWLAQLASPFRLGRIRAESTALTARERQSAKAS